MAAWMIPAAITASSLVGGLAAKSAADTQARATDRATQAQERMFGKQVELQEPFRQVGVNALPALVAASEYDPFTLDKFQADPGYGFRFKEGLRALENRAAARGNLLSGNQMRELVNFGQNLASQEYGNAFNRYQAEFASRLNPYQALAGVGQTSANTLTNAAGDLGRSIGSNIVAGGVARASGNMGMANALSSGLGQYLAYNQNLTRNAMDQQYIDALRSGQNTYFNPTRSS
jgi:hypothetical protein